MNDDIEILAEAMNSLGRRDALDLRARAKDMDGTQIIEEENKIPDFDPTKNYTEWPMGSPVIDDGQVWTLLQPYDASITPGRPIDLRALWGLCHTKDPKKAKAWVAPLGISGMYMIDECYRDGDKVYRCLQDNVVYTALEASEFWEEVTEI